MSKKIKGVILEDGGATLKYRTLMQDYHHLQKEVDMMSSRLEAGKQKKVVLAAEVRFLRKRFSYLVKTKAKNFLRKEKLEQSPILHKQIKQTEKRGRKEATLRILPPIAEVRAKKKQYVSKEVALRGTSPLRKHHRKMLDGGKETIQRISTMMQCTAPFFDLNNKGRMYENGTAPSNASTAIDLNQDDSASRRESPLPSRALIFDLNEISTGDEDFQTDNDVLKYEETRRSLMRHPNDEVQNELMLSICRNAGEGQSRVGKRKISWQDPVALRV